MIILTSVATDKDFEFKEGESIENYVSGVYFQEYYDPDTKLYTRDYFLPEPCVEVFQDLTPEQTEMFSGYDCPRVNMKILGQHGDGCEAQTFQYVLNSCESV